MNNFVVLGLGGPLLITLGLAAGEATADLALVCITDAAPVIAIADTAHTVTIEDSVPCP